MFTYTNVFNVNSFNTCEETWKLTNQYPPRIIVNNFPFVIQGHEISK